MRGVRKKSGWGVSWTTSGLSASTSTSGRLQPRTRGGMSQNGKTRGGTFHGKMNRCRKNQGWTTACSGMPERDGKDQAKASGLGLVRSPLLTSHKWRELVPSGHLVCRYHDVFLWCYVCFVLLRFRL